MLKKLFKKNTNKEDLVERKFNTIIGIIKDLPKSDYERFKKGMDSGYEAYQTIRNVRTAEEKAIDKQIKENADIDRAEKILDEK